MNYTCAYCQKHACHKNNLEDAPKNCPTKNETEKIEDCDVPMCNPIAQAKFLNEEKTEL